MGFGGDDDDDVTHLRPNSGNRLVSNQMFSNISILGERVPFQLIIIN